MKNEQKTTRIQRIVATALTIVFLPVIFGFGVYGLLSDTEELGKSLLYSHARKYLATEEDGTRFFPMLQARIQSLQNYLGDSIPLKDELGYLNASLQYAVGKNMVVQGAEQLVSLPGGQIYALTTRQSLADETQEIVDFYHELDGRVPFLFAYINPQFYDGSITLPEKYAAVDTSDELADEVLGIVRDAGIPALDSRTFFADCGYTDNDLILKTDMHWTTLAALLATPIYVDEINRLSGAHLDASRIALDQFDTQFYPNLFLGEYGQQVGERNSGLDDITLYLPKYETNLVRHSVNRDGSTEDASGPFAESVIKWDAFDTEPDGSNIRGYVAYGLIEQIEEITNLGDCEDMTLLIFRDSYTAPIGSFLSLLVKNVIMVDMRGVEKSAMELVDEYNPDMIVFSYSRQMLEDHHYSLK